MKYFNLYSNCIPVLGAKKAILCDLFRERYLEIPISIASLFFKRKSIPIHKTTPQKDPDLLSLLHLLIDDDWGHFTQIPAQFPPLTLKYEHDGVISNFIIDVKDQIDYALDKLVAELDDLGCHAVQIRFFKVFDLDYINSILKSFQTTGIQYLEILLQHDEAHYSEQKLKAILLDHLRLKNIYIFSASKNEIVTFTNTASGHKTRVIYSTDDFKNELACGRVTKGRFTINLINFTEAKNFNSCLNCKLSIDAHGNIKNCPSMKEDFGNIKNVSLADVIQDKKWNKLSAIKKDQIAICKDCEFRYICTDCRAFTEDIVNIFSKPAKCSYNPYIGEWE